MALVDDVIIRVRAGNGGEGGKSFSSGVAADGGNGGRGGDIYIVGNRNVADLSQFTFRKDFHAGDGTNGQGKYLHGKKGADITLQVPIGTTVTDTKTNQKTEILEEDKPILAAEGGYGKIGNKDELTATRRHEMVSDEMQKGISRELHFVLHLIADIGLIGLPNAGKSSLLASLTRANPKIGNYPFTTLDPNLGIIKSANGAKEAALALADIPGLVEGASTGKGLGIKFLKHIQKTKVLFHCIDATSQDLYKDYTTVREEFKAYDEKLLKKPEIILLTKIDLLENGLLEGKINELEKTKKQIIPLSIYDNKSLDEVKKYISEISTN